MHDKLLVTIKGITPLMMHNGQTADPLNDYAIALGGFSRKGSKSEKDHLKIQEIEWFAGLYVNEEEQVIVPGANLESTIIAGAKKSKCGPKAKTAVIVEVDPRIMTWREDGDTIKMAYLDLSPKQLYADGKRYIDRRMVSVNRGSKIARTRPIFRRWGLNFEVSFDSVLANRNEVISWITDAGLQVGLGDYRPKYGRFEVLEAI